MTFVKKEILLKIVFQHIIINKTVLSFYGSLLIMVADNYL